MTDEATTSEELLVLNRRLLESITAGDWETYAQLCDPTLTAYEPEARGHLVEGMDFHRFYFQRGGVEPPCHTTMSSPHVRLLGDVAVVCCVRLVQYVNETGAAVTSRFEETRVWARRDGTWRHVHFHRSSNG